MRNVKLIALAALFLPLPLLAQTGGSKVGIINMDRAALESAEGQQAAQTLETYYNERAEVLQQKQTQLNELQQRYEAQQRALAPDALAALQRDIQRLSTDLQRDTEDAQADLQAQQERLLRPVYERVSRILEEYAAQQQFTMIFDVSNSGLVYASQVADVTDEIIRRLNSASTGGVPQP